MNTTDPANESDLVYELRERIRGLEEIVGLVWAPPRALDLTTTEAAILGMILADRAKTRTRMYSALYGDRLDPPADTIITVYISKIRRKLTPFGVEIETTGHRGYRLTPENRERLFDLYGADEQLTTNGTSREQIFGEPNAYSKQDEMPQLRAAYRQDDQAVPTLPPISIGGAKRNGDMPPATGELS